MRNLPNIEKSAFRKGTYVGYAKNKPWTVRRDTGDIHSANGAWRAYTFGENIIYARTLTEMSAKLSAL